ncbi:MAG: phytase, partial [Xanthomonadales bacterium]|nr:phytase [Xanthomonadales bacterium]
DLTDPYGLCLYHSALDGRFHVFVNDSIDGRTLQFALQDDGEGGIAHERLRDIPVGAQAEGCVADDETGALFVAEEEHGIWKYGAEADGGNARSLVDSFENGRLIPDVEGLALWKTSDNAAVDNASNAAQTPHGGYLVASNQGRDSYLLYDRQAPHAFVGEFFIVAGNGIDGASETDGLEVTSAHLGPNYPAGLLVVQDGRNLGPRERQNFKLVSWRDIQESLNLP